MRRELSHRLRNALTLVQAMVGQTLRTPTTLSDGRATEGGSRRGARPSSGDAL